MTPVKFIEKNNLFPVVKGQWLPRGGGPDTWTHIRYTFSDGSTATLKKEVIPAVPSVRWAVGGAE